MVLLSRGPRLEGRPQPRPVVETIFLRDLLRHRKVVERSTSVKEFTITENSEVSHPVSATLVNLKNGETEVVRAKFLIGADGGSSTIRKQIDIGFTGVSTGIYWGIMDAVYETTYPHAGVFGCVVSSKHGGCVIIPRENGMIRLYTQIDPNRVVGKDRLEEGGAMDIGSITPEEVLAQANRIFAPFTIKFASPLHWFSIWKISERVADRFSYKNRVHLVGDACHVHSVMGAFGLNASILDSANVAWKMAACIKGLADPEKLMPTYEMERRRHAAKIIETSGTYLRFVCSSDIPVVKLDGVGMEDREDSQERADANAKAVANLAGIPDPDKKFLREFYVKNTGFLLGVDCPYAHNLLNPPQSTDSSQNSLALSRGPGVSATEVRWGVRAPNPRITFGQARTGYLYDAYGSAGQFTLVVFASNLQGPVVKGLKALEAHFSSPSSFFSKFTGTGLFKLVLVTNLLPLDLEEHFSGENSKSLKWLRENAFIVWDDGLPGNDAHSVYGVDHTRGAVVVVRPDLWTGISVGPEDSKMLDEYFGRFLTAPRK
ncbi:Phenol 2-monooxygenase [Grifola frondosa]|uniref:Phenol 2-monooxygenase n=1 Tax=Grifola frondosa TaxID=5627 RepID=A0A1C7LM66_GRIFR|nr:Phenol 2-monooxygenase [Grifola frondosa]